MLQDRYRLDDLVATGGLGAVFRGMHLRMRKEIAIKVLHPETENFPEMIMRFEREAVAGAHISHPNVASASDMGTFDGGSYFLVQEFVRGQTLRDLLDAEGPLAPDRAIHLVRQIALGLGAAHDRGIIHRDLKPRNLMVTPRPAETVKIIDFGFAKVPIKKVAHTFEDEEPSQVSLPGVVFGSIAYMAPEIIAGMESIDARSDLYSVGILFYEMLTGQHPFDQCEPHEMLKKHRTEIPPRMNDRSPNVQVPPALEAIVMRLLDKDPDRRYQVAAELVEALSPLSPAIDEPSAPRAFSTAPRSSAQTASRRWLFGFAALALVGVAVGGVFGVKAWRGHETAARSSASAPAEEASAADSATAAPVVDIGASLRADLLKAAAGSDDAESAAVLVALADVDKKALHDPELRAAATRIAARAGDHTGDDASQIFYVLSYRFGSDGLDILYDLTIDSKNPKAGWRAGAILEKQASSERATPALRVAVELRRAACKQKATLFSRAASEGDARVLAQLKELQPPACDPTSSACCYRHHMGLEKAIAALDAKK